MCQANTESKITENINLLPIFWLLANSYRECFEKCFNIEMNSKFCWFVPIITNGNFAVELYLKFLSGYEQNEKQFKDYFTVARTHNLKKLFYSLKGKTQAELMKLFDKETTKEGIVVEYIKKHKTDFVDWRYPLEDSLNTDLDALTTLINVLYEYCKDIINCKIDLSKVDLDEVGGYSIKITL